ncbi:hypothetical protein LINPERHAP1_LOCUS17540 [Linum perenne]
MPPDLFSSWGVKPDTKNVHNLWLEISEGEISLADSTPPIRTLLFSIWISPSPTSPLLPISRLPPPLLVPSTRNRPCSDLLPTSTPCSPYCRHTFHPAHHLPNPHSRFPIPDFRRRREQWVVGGRRRADKVGGQRRCGGGALVGDEGEVREIREIILFW